MTKKIKLSCSSCKGEVVYDQETPQDEQNAHGRLHADSCEYKTAGFSLSYIADHGIPVESEVLA